MAYSRPDSSDEDRGVPNMLTGIVFMRLRYPEFFVYLTYSVKTDIVNMDTFADVIRKHRLGKGLPLRKVAGCLDIDQGLLSKMERGIRKPGRELVVKFAEFYGVNSDELLKAWISDKIIYELEGEENPIEVLRVAEQKIAYRSKSDNARSSLMKKCKRVLREFPAVNKAWMFGSFARGENRPDSDFDILIEVPRTVSFTLFDIAEIKEDLTRAIGREVDVVMKRALKTSVKERIKPDMRLFYEA
ncbi:MAG: nucleotidyltransferase domain-containing protein [Bacteroidota bacterium]